MAICVHEARVVGVLSSWPQVSFVTLVSLRGCRVAAAAVPVSQQQRCCPLTPALALVCCRAEVLGAGAAAVRHCVPCRH